MTQDPSSNKTASSALKRVEEMLKDFLTRKVLKGRLVSLLSGGRVFALSVVAVGGLFFAGYGHYTDPGPLQTERVVIIPHGATGHVISTLQKAGVLAPGSISALFFRTALLLTGTEGGIHAAELKFPAQVSMAHSLEILRHARPVSHSLTVAEGLTAAQIKTLLMQASALQGEPGEMKEGYIAPETYFYTWGMERQKLLQRMEELMLATLEDVWSQRDQEALQGVIDTPEQLLILASLIERETSVAEERPEVARVFINRLRQGMRLQTDPTVIYALSSGEGVLEGGLTHEDMKVDSPYNTYLQTGLPPGPICSPGVASLEAAAHPAEGDSLYFVATGHGGHAFAHTLSEQTAHVKAYKKAKEASSSGEE